MGDLSTTQEVANVLVSLFLTHTEHETSVHVQRRTKLIILIFFLPGGLLAISWRDIAARVLRRPKVAA